MKRKFSPFDSNKWQAKGKYRNCNSKTKGHKQTSGYLSPYFSQGCHWFGALTFNHKHWLLPLIIILLTMQISHMISNMSKTDLQIIYERSNVSTLMFSKIKSYIVSLSSSGASFPVKRDGNCESNLDVSPNLQNGKGWKKCM